MKFSTLLLLSTFTGSNAFYQSHDIITHDDGSVHLFEKTQHRRLATKNLKSHTLQNTKFIVHGSEYVTQKLHVDGITEVGGFEFPTYVTAGFGTNAVSQIRDKFSAGDGIAISNIGVITSTITQTTDTDTNTQLTTAQVREKFTAGDGISIAGGVIAAEVTQAELDAVVVTAGTGIAISNTGVITSLITQTTDTDTNTQLTTAQVREKFSAGDGISIAAGVITAAVTQAALDAVESGDTTALSQKEYRLERMLLLLCNTLGLKFAHLVRAVDATSFDEYERFGAIQVNDNDLYLANSNNNLVDVTGMNTQLCSAGLAAGLGLACDGSSVIRHALTYCAAAACDSTDFSNTGACCIAP